MNETSNQPDNAVTSLEESDSPQLSEQDLKRVERYLSSPIHQVDRKPFRPWLMMLGLVGVMFILSSISWVISKIVLG
jgi:hypothetical protein